MIAISRKVHFPGTFVLLLPVFVFAQAKAVDPSLFLGHVSEGRYRNGFFGFTMSLPPEMYVLTDQERAIYTKAGVQMFSKDLEKGRAAYEKAASQEVLIFSLAMNKPSATGVSSLNIGVVKQPSGTSPGIVCDTAADFFVRNP